MPNDKPTTCYSMKHKEGDDKTAEIMIYDDIGPFYGGITDRQFAADLKSMGEVSEINVRISSQGGDVFQGLAIYNLLRKHPAKVVVDVDSLAASIASVIVQAGDERRIASNAMLMLHEPWAGVQGTADDLRAKAVVLDQIRDTAADTYAGRSGGSRAAMLSLMENETWLTSDAALELGLVDSVTGEMNVAAHVDAQKMNLKNVPVRFGGKVEPKEPEEPSTEIGKEEGTVPSLLPTEQVEAQAIKKRLDAIDEKNAEMQTVANLRKGAGAVWRKAHPKE